MSDVAPSDPGDAVQQLLNAADKLIDSVKDAYAEWEETYPPQTLMEVWNAEVDRYRTERSRVLAIESLALDLGWNVRPNPEIIHHQIRELVREAGNQLPCEPDWLAITPIVKWRALQRPAKAILERLAQLRLEALRIVGAFPTRPDTEIQELFDRLMSECKHLTSFAPLDFSQHRRLTPQALRTETEETRHRLNVLTSRIPLAQAPLCDLLAMYTGKRRPFHSLDTKEGGSGSTTPCRALATDACDPLARRAALRDLAPKLEALAVDYAARSEPQREALNAMLAAGPDEWPEMLYAAGPLCKDISLKAAIEAWNVNDDSPAMTIVVHVLFRMAEAAIARDRATFETLRGNLARDAALYAVANTARRQVAAVLLMKARNLAREATLESAWATLGAVGLDVSSRTADTLRKVECPITPLASAALRHWIDPDAADCWPDAAGRLLPVGERPALAETTPASEAAQRKGTPPAGIEDHDDPLDDREELILIEMLSLALFTYSARLKQAKIVEKCQRGANPDSWKTYFSKLKKRGYLDSVPGPSGGVWLTPAGKALAEKLMSE